MTEAFEGVPPPASETPTAGETAGADSQALGQDGQEGYRSDWNKRKGPWPTAALELAKQEPLAGVTKQTTPSSKLTGHHLKSLEGLIDSMAPAGREG